MSRTFPKVTDRGFRIDRVDLPPAEEVEAIARRAADTDGTNPLGEQPLRQLRVRRDDLTHIVATLDGAVAGYAQIDGTGEDATAEYVVDPPVRRRGLGTAMVKTIFEVEPAAQVWAHGDTAAAHGMAVDVGLVKGRDLLIMRRRRSDGPELDAPDAPEGVEFGSFDEAGERWPAMDARAEFLRVNNAAFSWHPEQGGWSAELLDERLGVDWVDEAGIFFAVDVADPDAPTLLGFHWTKVHPPDECPANASGSRTAVGEVYVVGVDPAAQGRKLGSKLTRLGVRYLEGSGIDETILYVEGDNIAARRTYERLGFVVAHRDVTYLAM